MNTLEHWFCSTSFWRRTTEQKLLPWLLSGVSLGEHVLEIGAGSGAATSELLRRAPRVTSLEYDHRSARRLAQRVGRRAAAVQADAASLPFANSAFSCVIAVLALHHLKSSALQDRAFDEIRRVLRPGGSFLAFEIEDGWLHRVAHFRSTFVPVARVSLSQRLAGAGFNGPVTTDSQMGGFRFHAARNT